jgi:hypothetical protein
MPQRIIYQTNNGVAVIIPTPEALTIYSIKAIAAKDVPPNTEYKIVDVSEIPTDREFRTAWQQLDDKIEINFDKAKEITKKRLREERKSLLAQQDVEFLKAIESDSDKSEIIKEKKRLRDITKLVDGTASLQELKELKAEKPKPDPAPEPERITPEEPVEPVVQVEPIIDTDPKIRPPGTMVFRID